MDDYDDPDPGDDWGWHRPSVPHPPTPVDMPPVLYGCPQCQDTAFIPAQGKNGYTFVRPCDECGNGAAIAAGWWSKMQERRANRKSKPANHRLHDGPASPSKWGG
jgi:hypothetical protein